MARFCAGVEAFFEKQYILAKEIFVRVINGQLPRGFINAKLVIGASKIQSPEDLVLAKRLEDIFNNGQ